eukprot:4780468-Pleurochrysis_carterae.AAC.1
MLSACSLHALLSALMYIRSAIGRLTPYSLLGSRCSAGAPSTLRSACSSSSACSETCCGSRISGASIRSTATPRHSAGANSVAAMPRAS